MFDFLFKLYTKLYDNKNYKVKFLISKKVYLKYTLGVNEDCT